LFSLAVRLAPDESSISTTVGWMQQLSALGQFLGPPLVGWIAAGTGGWQWTWVVTGACCVLGLVVAHAINRQLHHDGR
jgi:MFS family permease